MALFSFTSAAIGQTVMVPFTATDPNFPQHFSLTIESVEEFHAGVYTAMALGKKGCSLSCNYCYCHIVHD